MGRNREIACRDGRGRPGFKKKISSLRRKLITFSLEVFPPKTATASLSLWKAINLYEGLGPSFISVTCHGQGTKMGLTRELVQAMVSKNSFGVAPHMVCANQSKEEITELATSYWNMGVRKIVALRGDITDSTHGGDFKHATELVKHLKSLFDFEICVAGYPECHPESPSQSEDIKRLKEKTDAGANQVITQFFFDPEVYLRFRDLAVKEGVKIQITPGILPVLNFKSLVNFAAKCQANVPPFLHKMFAESPEDEAGQRLLAMNVMTHQITKLIDNGVENFHFYTLNELTLTSQTCRWLNTAF